MEKDSVLLVEGHDAW